MSKNCGRRILGTVLLLVSFVFSCQPQTKQDRAGVGPDLVNSPTSGAQPTATSEPGASEDGSSTLKNVPASEWEQSLKSLCEQGKPSACSQLAYEAQRAQKNDEAIGYFTRACVMDGSLGSCATAQTALKGLARSCFELAILYQQKSRSEESGAYRKCACDRGFKPACI